MLSTIYCIVLSVAVTTTLTAQQSITGKWLAAGEKRVIHVFETGDGTVEGRLLYSKNKNDSEGMTVLKNVIKRNKKYYGSIYSVVDSSLVRPAFFRLKEKGNILHITIPRFMLFHVRLKWYRFEG